MARCRVDRAASERAEAEGQPGEGRERRCGGVASSIPSAKNRLKQTEKGATDGHDLFPSLLRLLSSTAQSEGGRTGSGAGAEVQVKPNLACRSSK